MPMLEDNSPMIPLYEAAALLQCSIPEVKEMIQHDELKAELFADGSQQVYFDNVMLAVEMKKELQNILKGNF